MMENTQNEIKATVFIPTYNGEKYLPAILSMVLAQKVTYEFEVLIIDSGSSDSTLSIVNEFVANNHNVRLHQIPNTEFGHGKTRNLAAQMAKGEIVVYISHDAVPAHDRWLYEMVRPFEMNAHIVGVMGKQIPRPSCIPMLKSEINGVFAGFGPDFGTTIFYKDDFIKDQGTYDAVGFYSDSNSAARKGFLTREIPYRDVKYAEDQLFGRDIIEAGYYKVYAPRGSVVHSNDLTLGEYSKRMFDETIGLRRLGITHNGSSLKTVIKMVVRGTLRDTVRIMHDREYSGKRKVYWWLMNPLFHIEKWRGIRRAYAASLDDSGEKHSLEASRAKKA